MTLQQQPRVFLNEEEVNKLPMHKTKADGTLGPDRTVPSSVERKPKGPRHLSPICKGPDDGDMSESGSDEEIGRDDIIDVDEELAAELEAICSETGTKEVTAPQSKNFSEPNNSAPRPPLAPTNNNDKDVVEQGAKGKKPPSRK